jgi:hypothetical protein
MPEILSTKPVTKEMSIFGPKGFTKFVDLNNTASMGQNRNHHDAKIRAVSPFQCSVNKSCNLSRGVSFGVDKIITIEKLALEPIPDHTIDGDGVQRLVFFFWYSSKGCQSEGGNTRTLRSSRSALQQWKFHDLVRRFSVSFDSVWLSYRRQ